MGRPHHLPIYILMGPVIASLACGSLAPVGTAAPPASTAVGSPPATPMLAAESLIVGIEYAYPQAAISLADSGAASAKPYPDMSAWGKVQVGPGEPYNWRQTDDFVRAFQQSGFRHLTLMVRASADWAAITPPVALVSRGDNFPKPEYEDDYAAYVQAMVERYDLDGIDDMPGLAFPVTLFGFEPEYSTYWSGSAQEYIRLLQLAYPAVKAANPQAQVMTAGLLMTGVFQGYPSEAEIENRLAHPDPRIFDKTAGDIALLLDHPELFDIVDFHALGNYSEIPATVAWLRAEMTRRGYEKPIWIGDTYGGSALNGWGPAACPAGPMSGVLEYPATEADRCDVAATLQALRDSRSQDHASAIEWIRAESAAGVVRKIVLAAGEQLAGINIGNVEDWETLALTLGGAGTTPWQGMLERDMLTKEFRGFRPAYYALRQVSAIIRDYSTVVRIEAGDPRVYLYDFRLRAGGRVIVAWADAGLWLPGKPMPTRQVQVPVGEAGPVRLEWTVTRGSQPEGEPVTPESGRLTLSLGPIPAFLWIP